MIIRWPVVDSKEEPWNEGTKDEKDRQVKRQFLMHCSSTEALKLVRRQFLRDLDSTKMIKTMRCPSAYGVKSRKTEHLTSTMLVPLEKTHTPYVQYKEDHCLTVLCQLYIANIDLPSTGWKYTSTRA